MRQIALAGLLWCLGCSGTAPVNTCPSGQSACGSNCVRLNTDDANCGSCGKTCAASEACGNGACFPKDCGGATCAPDAVCSENRCVPKDCVGVVCGTGLTCAQGVCVCGPGRLDCGGACVNPGLDNAHCGACGTACPAGASCASGACLPDDCPNTTCDPFSVCFGGSCAERACVGVVCPAGLSCRGGQCSCKEGEVSCGGVCVDDRVDSANCGGCGRTCAAGERCGGGVCLPESCGGSTCSAADVCFGGACVNRACVGVVCGGEKTCQQGVCTCGAGKSDCGATCSDLMGDGLNCGVCGNRCASGYQCDLGTCVPSGCPGGKRICSGSCVDTQTDPDHCGACGAACGGGRVCVAGACVCPSGLSYCGATCVNLQTDPSHCGACGQSCNQGTCAAGLCSCPPQQLLCSGTCRQIQSDGQNCGLCGRVCANGQTCQSGVCACPSGTALCGGSCLSTTADNLNCGACGNVCPQNTWCLGSICQQAFSCQTNFNAAPADCPLFPLSTAQCGQQSLVASVPFNGSISASIPSATQAIGMTASEEVRLLGTFTGSANFTVAMRNSSNSFVTPAVGVSVCCSATSTGPLDLRTTGSPYGCAHPTQAAVFYGNNPGTSFGLNIERWAFSGKYNTGGISPATATDLAKGASSNRVCDQVCGDVKTICGDATQNYRFVLPAQKAAVVEGVFSGRSAGTAFDLNIQTQAGGQICSLISNQTVTTTASAFKARIVNNTNLAQTVLLVPSSRGGSLTWNFAVAVEP
jgi:hypothetical protein